MMDDDPFDDGDPIIAAARSAWRLFYRAAIACAVMLALGAGVGGMQTAPDHALVFASAELGVYYAPPCVMHEDVEGRLELMTLREARDRRGFVADDACRAEGAFVQRTRSLSGRLMQRMGVLAPVPSRWDDDGSWNW